MRAKGKLSAREYKRPAPTHKFIAEFTTGKCYWTVFTLDDAKRTGTLGPLSSCLERPASTVHELISGSVQVDHQLHVSCCTRSYVVATALLSDVDTHPSLQTSGEAPAAEEHSSATDDSWMNDPEEDGGGFAGGAGVGGPEGTANVGGRSSWYRSQFKELENLGKGGFGTVVKVRAPDQ